MSTDNTSVWCLEVGSQELLLSRRTSIPEAAHGFNISCDTMVRSFGFGEVEGNEDPSFISGDFSNVTHTALPDFRFGAGEVAMMLLSRVD